MNKKTWIALGILGLVGSCCGPGAVSLAEPIPPAQMELLISYPDQMRRLEAQLHDTMTAATEPDCERACLLQHNICDLSRRICAISERHPGQLDASHKCTDATQRCERARADVAAVCTCPRTPAPVADPP